MKRIIALDNFVRMLPDKSYKVYQKNWTCDLEDEDADDLIRCGVCSFVEYINPQWKIDGYATTAEVNKRNKKPNVSK